MHTLRNKVAFPQRQAAADGRAGADDKGRVERVDIEGEVDGCFCAEVGEGQVHYFAYAVAMRLLNGFIHSIREDEVNNGGGGTADIPIDIMHTKRLDAVLSQYLLLTCIYVSQTNVHQLLEVEQLVLVVLKPAEDVFTGFFGEAC
jgi:hypothetical protein